MRVETSDPIYGAVTPYYVYTLNHDGEIYHVAYQEHTPGVYLAFADEKTLPMCSPRFGYDSKGKPDCWVRVD